MSKEQRGSKGPVFQRKVPKFLAALGYTGSGGRGGGGGGGGDEEGPTVVQAPELEDRDSNEEEKPVVVDLDMFTRGAELAEEKTLGEKKVSKKRRSVIHAEDEEKGEEKEKAAAPAVLKKPKQPKKRVVGLSFREDDV